MSNLAYVIVFIVIISITVALYRWSFHEYVKYFEQYSKDYPDRPFPDNTF